MSNTVLAFYMYYFIKFSHMQLLCPFFRCRNWGSGSRYLPKDNQLASESCYKVVWPQSLCAWVVFETSDLKFRAALGLCTSLFYLFGPQVYFTFLCFCMWRLLQTVHKSNFSCPAWLSDILDRGLNILHEDLLSQGKVLAKLKHSAKRKPETKLPPGGNRQIC